MNRYFSQVAVMIVLALIAELMSFYLEANFIVPYLTQNILSLLLTLLAINAATSGLIASKMQDLLVKHKNINFDRTIKEMKISFLEQLLLILVSIVSLIILDSKVWTFEYKEFIFETILIAAFFYDISILWDTGNGVFVIIEQIQKINKENQNNKQ